MSAKTINNPASGLTVIVNADDPVMFDEMLREMASGMANYIQANKDVKHLDVRDVFQAAYELSVSIAARRQCSKQDWVRFVGYAGLLAAQAAVGNLTEHLK